MTIALENVLAKVGLRIDAKAFLTLLEDSARKLAPQHPEPAIYFSAEQQAALGEAGLDLAPRRRGDQDSRARLLAAYTVLAESALTVQEAATKVGVDASRIRHRLGEGRLTGWKDQGEWRLPAWQFLESAILPGLEVVLAALPEDQPAVVVANFMSTSQSELSLGGEPSSPRQWLLAGGSAQEVAKLATQLGTPA